MPQVARKPGKCSLRRNVVSQTDIFPQIVPVVTNKKLYPTAGIVIPRRSSTLKMSAAPRSIQRDVRSVGNGKA